MNRRAYLAAAAGAVGGLAGCLGVLADEDYDVGMTVNAFTPEEYRATVGETVVWRNTSSRGHTVTAYENAIPDDAEYFASGGYDSEIEAREAWVRRGEGGRIAPGEEFAHTFEVPGEHHYVCLPHEARIGMTGVVTVEE